MPKRKRPITRAAQSAPSKQITQATISQYHTLLKQRRQRLAAGQDVAELDAQIQASGGIDAYQRASQVGQSSSRGGDSSRILIPWLEARGKVPIR